MKLRISPLSWLDCLHSKETSFQLSADMRQVLDLFLGWTNTQPFSTAYNDLQGSHHYEENLKGPIRRAGRVMWL